MWIASSPNAFVTTLLVGLIAGFFLGAHAVTGSNATGASMIGVAVFGTIVGAGLARRFGRGQAVSCECDPPRTARRRPTLSPGSDPAIEDAEVALRNLGCGARDARAAVTSALATLGDDADAAAIVKAAPKRSR
jgi:hypothetical protein